LNALNNRVAQLVVSALGVGCQLVAGYETFHGGAEPSAAPHPCDVLMPKKADVSGVLVLTKQASGSCFWIDQTEVTVAAYREYLSQVSSPLSWSADDSASCAWKAEPFDPEHATDDPCVQETAVEDLPLADDKPIRCVDWCDALAYCRWAGKRLCSGDGVMTGVTTNQASLDWAEACSDGGAPYPYGGTKFVPEACNIGLSQAECANVLHFSVCGPTSVPSPAPLHCKSPNGAVDMVGNVAEWTANCGKLPSTDAQAQLCQIKGGSFADEATITCQTSSKYEQRTARNHAVGFRCCTDLTSSERAQLSGG
jgi:formylglycine-generating enzyme required for sulfatase activity